MKAVNDAARQVGMPVPPNLWHAMLFFNAGWITTEVLTAAGTRDYRMLMTTGPIFDRPGWHQAIARPLACVFVRQDLPRPGHRRHPPGSA